MGKFQTSLEKVDIMAVNNNGNLLDSAGEVAIDFVWGNFPIQPNDARPDTSTGRLDPALDNHIIALSGWNGFPQYSPNTAGEDVVGATDYVLVPSVLGLTTALATDAMKDASLVPTTATAATNAASTITAVSRTGTTATITSSGAGAKYPVGTKITVADLVSPDTALNGTWTVTAVATNTVSFTTTTSGALSTTGLTVAGLTGVAGTIKTQSVAAGANNTAPGAAVTITPWAAAS
jgi:hypothetical protein